MKQQANTESLEDPIVYEIEDLIKITRFKEDKLKEYFLHDPRISMWQRQAKERGKRVWLAKETRAAIEEIFKYEWQ
ncbi:hypothetical protein [Metasolibacillus meyeri]|uniref:hypothetical protein n=1 Tax=Metasolibacillus meyeri TaxID=1071052 RepID=UPI000D2F7083|nr:hypothetical protein [Metasolibacillus meyeri]